MQVYIYLQLLEAVFLKSDEILFCDNSFSVDIALVDFWLEDHILGSNMQIFHKLTDIIN